MKTIKLLSQLDILKIKDIHIKTGTELPEILNYPVVYMAIDHDTKKGCYTNNLLLYIEQGYKLVN